MENNKEFFICNFIHPIITLEGYPVDKVINDMYNHNCYPFLIIKDKNNEIHKLSQENAPKSFKVNIVIFSISYNKIFQA